MSLWGCNSTHYKWETNSTFWAWSSALLTVCTESSIRRLLSCELTKALSQSRDLSVLLYKGGTEAQGLAELPELGRGGPPTLTALPLLLASAAVRSRDLAPLSSAKWGAGDFLPETSGVIKIQPWDFPGGPAVKTLPFHCRGRRFGPCLGTKIPRAPRYGQKVKKKKKKIQSRASQLITRSSWQTVWSLLSLSVSHDLLQCQFYKHREPCTCQALGLWEQLSKCE